jgi:serine/threonine protein kinase
LAIKMVPVDRSRSLMLLGAEEEGLQLEARLMFQLEHPNIVRVLAVVTRSLPSWICLEFMPNGDLKSYLRFGLLVFFIIQFVSLTLCV